MPFQFIVIYSCSKSRVRSEEKLSEAFHITAGVIQGDTLALSKSTKRSCNSLTEDKL